MNPKHWKRTTKLLVFAPVGIAGLALFLFICGEIVRRLWNWLLPALFGLPAITFWQAIGLLVLSRMLFGGFGGRGGSHDHKIGSRIADRIGDRVADRVGARLDGLSPEERERFTQRLRERWGATPSPTEHRGQ